MNCSDVYNIFFKPGELTEIRAHGVKGNNKAWEGYAGSDGIVYGYFDNADDFGRCAEALDAAKAPGIYFVLNPIIPDLLARANNRLKAATRKSIATSDKDILFIRWLYIDLDPIRPAGISSTDDELKKAIRLRNKIHKCFKDLGAKHCIPAMSGNGAHLMVKLKDTELTNRESPSQDPRVIIIKNALNRLAEMFGTKDVDVDRSVYNPSRICKVYGTAARKGDHIKIRPHRRSYIEPKFLEGRK